MLSPEIIKAAQDHARAEYPKESCGFVIDERYVPAFNEAEDPTTHFQIPAALTARYMSGSFGQVRAVLHSHPGGPFFPSEADMIGQIQSNVPWGIIALDGDRISAPVMWGDGLSTPPLVGRSFMHGVTDCYSIIRDAFKLGKDAMLEQGLKDWPFDPIVLPEVPRSDNWWSGEKDLYQDHFKKFGFHPIDVEEARPGDVFLVKIRSPKFNHGGILIGQELIVHHLPKRLSRREPASLWGRAADLWIRHEAANA